MPPVPSHTTTTGSAMRAIRFVHPALVSRRATCQPMDVAVGVGDEHDRLAAQMDAAEVHHIVDLPVHRAWRP